MPAKIRLARHGRRKKPFYHIVVADSRAPRDGKYIQKLGVYNPMTVPATIELDRDAAFDWLMKGAEPTDTARSILRFKGVLYRKHLQRGVIKGALTQDEADNKYEIWIKDKEDKIAKRRAEEGQRKKEWRRQVAEGIPHKIAPPVKEEMEAFTNTEDTPVEVAEQTESSKNPALAEIQPEPVETVESVAETEAPTEDSVEKAVTEGDTTEPVSETVDEEKTESSIEPDSSTDSEQGGQDSVEDEAAGEPASKEAEATLEEE